MKKIALALMLASVAMTMTIEAKPQRTEQVVLPRGQPAVLELSYEITPVIGYAEITIQNVEMYLENPSAGLVAEIATEKTSPGIVEGDRKIRDVDWCSVGNYNYNYDKRSAIHQKTVYLPRGVGSIRNC